MQVSWEKAREFAPGFAIVFGALAGIFPYLWHWDRLITRDWPYFLALALVNRSNILSYGTFPPHDPWVSGGADVLANPQSRMLSPSFLLELSLPPYPALLAILFVYAAVGAWGMYRLLRDYDASKLVATTVALFFVNSSWFGLHFAEGHFAYPAFMLFPWLLYASRGIYEPRRQLLMCGLFAFFVIDGAMYSFIFGLYMLPFLIVIDWDAWLRLVREWRQHALRLVGMVVGAGLIAAAKAIPVLAIHASRPPDLDRLTIPPESLLYILFYPFQSFASRGEVPGLRWGFHEYGCYIGVVALVAALASLIPREHRMRGALYLVSAAFFLFTASGLGGAWDPWLLIHEIPFLNQAHVQSRLTIIFFTLFCAAAGLGLTTIQNKKWLILVVCAFLVVESTVARNYPQWQAYEIDSSPRPVINLLEGGEFEKTRRFGPRNHWTNRKLSLYDDKGMSTLEVYEPTRKPTSVQHAGQRGYRGEAYPVDVRGTAKIESYEPGRVVVVWDLEKPGDIQLNTNQLGGWEVERGEVQLTDDPTTLVTFTPDSKKGRAVLAYRPDYLPLFAISLTSGLIIFLSMSALVFRREQEDV